MRKTTIDSTLLTALSQDGFLHLPRLLEPTLVRDVGRQIRDALATVRWLPEQGPEAAGRQEGSEGWWEGYARIQAIEAVHSLAYERPLVDVLRKLLPAAFVHPRKIVRLLYPHFAVPLHQDYPTVQGTVDVLTLWVPLVTLPATSGALRVLRRPLDRLLPLRPLPDAGAELANEITDGDWATYEYRTGDVVVLHSLTVHEVTVNRDKELALACEYRCQSGKSPVCVASLEPHHYPRVPGFDHLAAGWQSRRWVRVPRFTRRQQFTMPVSIDTWHEVLSLDRSRLVSLGSLGAADRYGRLPDCE